MHAQDLLLPLLPWAVANLFVLGLALVVREPLRVGHRRLDLLTLGFLHIFLTTLVVMLCGLAGWLDRMPIFLVSLAGLLTGWAWHRLRGPHPANPWSQLRRGAAALGKLRPLALITASQRPWTGVFLLLLILIQAVRLAVHVWYLPPYVWDVLSYHLPRVAEWVQHHGLVIFDTPVARSFWPANHELFQSWFVLFPHHDFLIDAADIPFYLLAAGSVYSAARSLGLNRRLGVFAALLYAYTPAVALHATACKNDLAIAAIYLFVLALLLDWRERSTHLRRRLVLIWLALCLAVGTKATIAFLVPGLLVVAFQGLRARREVEPEPASRSPRRTLGLAAAGAAGLLIGGFWYLRNLAVFHNPFHPTSFRLFGRLIFGTGSGLEQQGSLSLTSLVRDLDLLLHEKIFDFRDAFTAELHEITGWGWFVFCCGWPILVYGILRERRVRWLAGCFLLSLACLLAAVSPDPWNMRFALWFPALPALSFALVIGRLRIPALRRTFYLLAMACLALNLLGTLDIGRLSPAVWKAMAGMGVAERSTAKLGLYIGGSYGRALATVPPEEVLGFNVNPNGWIYPLYGADYSRRIRYVPIDPVTEIPAAMRQRGVWYLFVSRPFPQELEQVEALLSRGGLQKIGDGLWVRPGA